MSMSMSPNSLDIDLSREISEENQPIVEVEEYPRVVMLENSSPIKSEDDQSLIYLGEHRPVTVLSVDPVGKSSDLLEEILDNIPNNPFNAQELYVEYSGKILSIDRKYIMEVDRREDETKTYLFGTKRREPGLDGWSYYFTGYEFYKERIKRRGLRIYETFNSSNYVIVEILKIEKVLINVFNETGRRQDEIVSMPREYSLEQMFGVISKEIVDGEFRRRNK